MNHFSRKREQNGSSNLLFSINTWGKFQWDKNSNIIERQALENFGAFRCFVFLDKGSKVDSPERKQGKDKHAWFGFGPLKILIFSLFWPRKQKTCLWDYTLLWICNLQNLKARKRKLNNKLRSCFPCSTSILIPLGVIVVHIKIRGKNSSKRSLLWNPIYSSLYKTFVTHCSVKQILTNLQ